MLIRTHKTLQHVSITRSSSGTIYCSLLKLQFKTFSELLGYVNFGVVAACLVVLCVSRTVFRMGLVMVVGLMLCSVRLARYGLRRTLCSVRLAHFGCASYAVQRESHAAQHTTHNHNQAHSKHRTTHTQKHKTCCHSTKINITK